MITINKVWYNRIHCSFELATCPHTHKFQNQLLYALFTSKQTPVPPVRSRQAPGWSRKAPDSVQDRLQYSSQDRLRHLQSGLDRFQVGLRKLLFKISQERTCSAFKEKPFCTIISTVCSQINLFASVLCLGWLRDVVLLPPGFGWVF